MSIWRNGATPLNCVTSLVSGTRCDSRRQLIEPAELKGILRFFDLNLPNHTFSNITVKGVIPMAHELRPNRLLTSHRITRPRYEFQKCVARYRGDYQQKGFSCWDQFLAMAFAQLTYRESLRDIEACCTRPRQKALPHGIPKQGGADDTGRRQRAARVGGSMRISHSLS